MTSEFVCWKCGETLKNLPRRVPRLAECVDCRADLHVCLMCRHYAPRYVGQCAHDRAERVVDKKKSNFCTYFRPRPNAHLPPGGETEDASRAELMSIFGESPAQQEQPPSPPASELAMGELADFFGLENANNPSTGVPHGREELNALFGDTESSPAAVSSKDHRLFVYGTFKRGFPNHDEVMGAFDFVGQYQTFFAYPLVVGGCWFAPYLINDPGVGHCVTGEVFSVDAEGLAWLDAFEDHGCANGALRVSISVHELGHTDTEEVWTYVKNPDSADETHGEPLQVYDLDPRYVAPSQRGE